VDVFGHDYVGVNVDVMTLARLFQALQEEVAQVWGLEFGESVVTTEGQEV
jgi:hypothetical protein